MQMTPAIKGQLTKALKAQAKFAQDNAEVTIDSCLEYAANPSMYSPFTAIRDVLKRHMPAEQAKHAARKLYYAA